MPQGAPQILPMAKNETKNNCFSMILEAPQDGQRAPKGHPEVLRATSGAPVRALEALDAPPRDLPAMCPGYLETVKALSVSQLHLLCERVVRTNHPLTCERVVCADHPFTFERFGPAEASTSSHET